MAVDDSSDKATTPQRAGDIQAIFTWLGHSRLELASFRDRKIKEVLHPADRKAAMRWLTERDGAADLYVCTNEVCLEHFGSNRRACAADIPEPRVLLLDVDPDRDDLAHGRALLAAMAMLSRVCQIDPNPLLVDSGRGAQILFRAEKENRFQKWNRLSEQFVGLLVGYNCKLDPTHDAARLCRMPGTKNLRTGRMARVIPVPSKLPRQLFETLSGKRPDLHDQSRSGYEMGLAHALSRFGFDSEEISELLKAYPHGRGEAEHPTSRKITARKAKQRETCTTETSAPTSGEGGRESAATTLVKLARERADFFHFGENSFATVSVGNHLETYTLKSRGFRCWLTKVFFEEQGRAASGEQLLSTIATLEGFARFQSEERPAFVRVAEHGGRIYLDLCDEQWRNVEIDAGGWRIVESKDSPVRFRRAHGMLALPIPECGGNIRELRKFLNLGPDQDFLLVVGWLIGALCPTGPYPILILHGEQGSAKTTTARVLRGLLDPNLAPVRSEPREPRDLMVAAANGWCCCFDNMSTIPTWFSDGLCRLSTGGGFSVRALYTDEDEVIFQAKRPVILTGIEEIATRGDLLDRSIILYLPRIVEGRCRPEKEFFNSYEAARPNLLGALVNAVSGALREIASVHVEQLPHMADFSLWISAAETALGWDAGSFLRAYQQNRVTANDLPLETPIAETLRKLALPWSGTATKLLAALESLTDERTRRLKSWPASGRTLSNALRRLAPNLRQAGVAVEFTREPGTGKRVITVYENTGDSSSQASQPSQSAPTRDECDDSDDEKPNSSDVIVSLEEEL